MKGQLLLHTDGLNVGYKNHTLFAGLNINIQSHQLVCFMGPNGAGKSTLIRILAGLQKPLEGTIHYKGAEQHPLSKLISVVLTDRIYPGHMKAYDLIALGRYPFLGWRLRMGAGDKHLIDQAITQTQTAGFLHKKLSALSDGQLQMVMIARALAQDGNLLILDEPTAHLDLNNRLEIMTLLRELAHNSGKGVLATTHDLHLALQTADEVWLAGTDKTIRTGIPEDLVLNGTFDDIFQFKGFDLRSGKVAHPINKEKKISLAGEGAVYLWTRNALERNGFNVGPDGVAVQILEDGNRMVWLVKGDRFESLEQVISKLNSLIL